MHKGWLTLSISIFLVMVTTSGISSWVSPGTVVAQQEPTPTISPTGILPTEDSWIIVDLPEDATQLEYGTEVYRLVCKACHGDKGQGLTEDWRAQWAPEDQNCWQSKCHALNHPPDGFYMPQVPKVLGQPIRNFGTALNLYTYTHNFMPWHDRGSMTEKESWSVTAYLLEINGIDPGPDLNAETAANIDLSLIDPNLGPIPAPPSPEAEIALTPSISITPSPSLRHDDQNAGIKIQQWIPLLALVVVVIIIIVVASWRRQPSE